MQPAVGHTYDPELGVSEAGDPASSPRRGLRRFVRPLCHLLICFAIAVALQVASNAFLDDFGGDGDEGAHYVTALMIRDYIAQGFPQAPLAYASNYYMHYPKVALGHWPPLFYVVQSTWMLLFSDSRTSILLLIALLSAGTSVVIYYAARKRQSELASQTAAAAFLLLPIVIMQNSMVMCESLLTLLTFGAVLVFAEYMEKPDWRTASWFGILAVLAIMTKANAIALAFIPPVAMLLSRDFSALRRWHFYLPGVIVVAVCAPYYLWSASITAQGMGSKGTGWAYTAVAVPALLRMMPHVTGFGLTLFACMGAWSTLIRPRPSGPPRMFWSILFAYIFGVFIVHAAIPANFRFRYLHMAAPAILLFAAAGMDWLAGSRLLSAISFRWRTAAACSVAALLFLGMTFRFKDEYCQGFHTLTRDFLSRPQFAKSTILVSSNDAYGESRFIAELASAEKRPGRIVVRGTKQLAKVNWMATDYHPLYDTQPEMSAALNALPAELVIVHTVSGGRAFTHNAMVASVTHSEPGRWAPVYSFRPHCSKHGGEEQFEVFRRTNAVPAGRIEVDLGSKLKRKLNIEIGN